MLNRNQSPPQLYLGSASPRRAELLSQLGFCFHVLPSHIDETVLANESPSDYVSRIALSKALATQTLTDYKHDLPILAADTTVVVENTILGKPLDDADALRMLQLLSGKTHQVMSAVAVIYEDKRCQLTQISDVTFVRLTAEQCEHYIQTGEHRDKAGAYGIQGFAAIFVQHLVGSFSGVMGLPLFETAACLREFNLDPLRSSL